MDSVRRGVAAAAATQVAALVAVAQIAQLGPLALAAGLAYGLVCDVLIVRGLVASAAGAIGAANAVTWLRCALAGGVVALVAEDLTGHPVAPVLLLCAGIALLLDAVDGRIARATGTVSAFGARFDMEVDASLILALSVAAVGPVGAWILLVGAARYLLLLTAVALPWLDGPVPPRLWRKAVAAVQGVVLAVVAGGVVVSWAAELLAISAAAALLLSFATQVMGLAAERRRAAVVMLPLAVEGSHV